MTLSVTRKVNVLDEESGKLIALVGEDDVKIAEVMCGPDAVAMHDLLWDENQSDFKALNCGTVDRPVACKTCNLQFEFQPLQKCFRNKYFFFWNKKRCSKTDFVIVLACECSATIRNLFRVAQDSCETENLSRVSHETITDPECRKSWFFEGISKWLSSYKMFVASK